MREQFQLAMQKVEEAFGLHLRIKSKLEELSASTLYLLSAESGILSDQDIMSKAMTDGGEINFNLINIANALKGEQGNALKRKQVRYSEVIEKSRHCLRTFENFPTSMNGYLTNPWCLGIQNSLPTRANECSFLDFMKREFFGFRRQIPRLTTCATVLYPGTSPKFTAKTCPTYIC